MNHIVVIGFMGSGKTRVGKRLSSDLGLTFVDVDKVIVKKMNMSVKEILQKFGEPYYLQVVHTVGGNQPVLGNAVKTKECSLKVH